MQIFILAINRAQCKQYVSNNLPFSLRNISHFRSAACVRCYRELMLQTSVNTNMYETCTP